MDIVENETSIREIKPSLLEGSQALVLIV